MCMALAGCYKREVRLQPACMFYFDVMNVAIAVVKISRGKATRMNLKNRPLLAYMEVADKTRQINV